MSFFLWSQFIEKLHIIFSGVFLFITQFTYCIMLLLKTLRTRFSKAEEAKGSGSENERDSESEGEG
jgi:hypothetical protein